MRRRELFWFARLRGHASFMLLSMSSAAYFIAMIIAKKTLSKEDFYLWNVCITIIAISFSFSFLGSEQLFIRFSKVVNGVVEISAHTLFLMLGSLFCFSISLSLLLPEFFSNIERSFLYFVIAIAVGVLVFIYNFLRIRRSFVLSQFAGNGWKIGLLIAALLGAKFGIESAVFYALAVACVISILLFFWTRHALKVHWEQQSSDWVQLYIGFAASLFVMMLIGNVDRFVMGRYASPEGFSVYVYMVSLLVMPFSVLSNYFGFREVAALKSKYVRGKMIEKVIKIGGLGALLFCLWFGGLYILSDYLELALGFEYFLPALIIVVLRNCYSLLSALFGLHGTPRQIQAANGVALIYLAIMVLFVVLHGVAALSVLWMVAGLWVVRFAIYWYFTASIRDYFSEENRAI